MLAAVVKPAEGDVDRNYYLARNNPIVCRTVHGFFRVFDTYVAYSTSKLGLDRRELRHQQVNKADDPGVAGPGRHARAFRYRRPPHSRSAPSGWITRPFGGINQVLQEVTATLEYKFADDLTAQ